jgi:hypothetical protein
MKNIMTQKSLQWTPDELAFQRKTANYVAEFDFAPGTDWTFDEDQQEYRCTFEKGRRKISVLISRNELLADFGRSNLSDGVRQKLDDSMGRQAGQLPSSRWLA